MSENVLAQNLQEAAAFVGERLNGRTPKIGIVLGSGLNPLANEMENPIYVAFGEVPHMKKSTAEGHVGRFVCGELAGKQVLAMQGRLHAYEGNSAQEVAFPIWLMARLGIEQMITTNATRAIAKVISASWPIRST